MKNKIDKTVIRIRAALVFLTMFVIILGCTFLVNENQKKKEQLKAAYTAILRYSLAVRRRPR